jgi:hypothetical protein
MTMTNTPVDTGNVAQGDNEFDDESVNFAGAATYLPGTILARLLVALAITPSAVTGTGNGTVTAASVVGSPSVPKVGNWTLRCTAAVANGGVWRLEDPDGGIVASGLTQTPGAGGATAFEAGGLAFTINDGGTDFAAGDTFTLPVVASSLMVPYSPSGAGGAQYPKAVLTYPVAATGAGNVGARVLVSGKVDKTRLVIHGGGTVTPAIHDQLRATGIIPVNVAQLDRLDNS